MDALTDPAVLLSQGMAIVSGLALAATCGLRAFLPLLAISLLARTGQIALGDAFAWMGSWPAIACFGTAVIAEVLADKVPAVDHALDAFGTVVKPVAATLATASMITEFDPLLAVVIGLVTGGVVAEGVHLVKAKTRLLSTAFTGTLANPVLSFAEDVFAFFGVILSWLVPIAVVALTVAVVGASVLWLRRRTAAAA